MIDKLLKCACLAVTCATIMLPTRAFSVEGAPALLPGVTVGLPAGAAPPPGLYFGQTSLYFSGPLVNGAGARTGVSISFEETISTLLVQPNISILGGQYYAFGALTLQHNDTNVLGTTTTANGFFNPIISPLNISWALGHGFFVSTGIGFYLPVGDYSSRRTHVANNFSTFQPSLGLTYLDNGINLTANVLLNVNLPNSVTNYDSGSLFGIDYTATKSIGKFTFGLNGYTIHQFQNDRRNGLVVGTGVSYGNRLDDIALGPYLAYDFGPVSVSAWYDHEVFTRNSVHSDIVWAKLAVPLGDPFSPATPVTPSALPVASERGR